MAITELTVETAAGPGNVELTRPVGASGLVLLTHGAGGGVQTVDLLRIRDTLTARGVAVGLVTQPYRAAGRGAPPAPARQDPAWLELVTAVRRRRGLGGALPLVLGGRSNGARVACRTAAAAGAAGVVALAFPLHPPGRPDKTRIDELDAVTVPVLVVQGDRDPFGMPPPGDRELVVIAGGDHSLKRDPQSAADAVGSFVTSIIERARVQK